MFSCSNAAQAIQIGHIFMTNLWRVSSVFHWSQFYVHLWSQIYMHLWSLKGSFFSCVDCLNRIEDCEDHSSE